MPSGLHVAVYKYKIQNTHYSPIDDREAVKFHSTSFLSFLFSPVINLPTNPQAKGGDKRTSRPVCNYLSHGYAFDATEHEHKHAKARFGQRINPTASP